ncbi:MAG: E3 binding domain-containing protein, partial [Calditrichaeota bacterium]|nr:E3 binding domain-containing protein [Calditrichota bacterium]
MAEMINILMPQSDEGTESVVERWLKKVGEAVTANEPLIEINTDKVSLEIPAPADGFLAEIVKKENEPVNPGDLLGRLSIKAKGESQKEKVVVPADMPKIERQRRTFVAGEREVRLSPIVRKMLAEHNIRPEEIIGSGRGGRITARDVENFIENRAEVPKAAPPVSAPSGKIPSHMVPHNALRRSTARHMVESMLNTAPHVTAVFDADLSGVVAHRAKNKAIYESKGVKLTFTAYFV